MPTQLPKLAFSGSATWYVVVAATTLLLMLFTQRELSRVQRGQLFLFPSSQPALHTELVDAKQTAAACQVPAMVFLGILGCTMAIVSRRDLLGRSQTRPLPRWLAACLILAALLDLGTTIWFFHTLGIDHELHPAIRLMGYAYGRALGPLVGKTIQTVGILIVASWMKRGGTVLVATTTVVYMAAAIHNLAFQL